jgi:hypothetical protein
MSYAPRNVIVIGVDFGRKERPRPYRHHRVERERLPRQDIPRRDLDSVRRILEEMRERARRHIAERRGEIQALRARGRLLLQAA